MNATKLSLAAALATALFAASAAQAATVTTGNSGLVLGAYSQGYDATAAKAPGTPVTTSGSPIEFQPY